MGFGLGMEFSKKFDFHLASLIAPTILKLWKNLKKLFFVQIFS